MSNSTGGDSPRKWFSIPIRTSKRSRAGRMRKRNLRAERLETRRLLAAGMDGFRHNMANAEDVNGDGQVSALDALSIINAMNRDARTGDALQEGVAGDVEMFTDVNNDGRRTASDALMVINRLSRNRFVNDSVISEGPRVEILPDTPGEVRSIDGTGNNLTNPELGSAGQALLRIAEADYGDGISTPAGADRPSTREISNLLSGVVGDGTTSERDVSAFLFVWGQFLDHDIDLTLTQEDGEMFAIEVPEGDPFFDPGGTGDAIIPLMRSQFDSATGTSIDNPRQQINAITSYIDGSQVYGSDQAAADSLRTFAGGRLNITEDGLLPLDEQGMLIAGDIRASENPSLAAMQTLFVREHNRLANKISAANPEASDEEIYQQARAIVIAQIQAITYNEFLPALLGDAAISQYEGYNATVDPRIAIEFSTAAFRFGHSTLNESIGFFDNDGRDLQDEIELKDAFFNVSVLEESGIGAIFKYGASSLSQEIDLEVVDSLRNFLFGPPGAGGFDLVALNIQRGRDHGLADYNATRVSYGLDAANSFADITSDTDLQEKLASLYGDVHNIDLWVGLMAEDHLPGSSVGELTSTIIADQFERLRDGDRLWYENVYADHELRQLQRTSLADVIERNTTVEGLQQNVFFMVAEVGGRVTVATTDGAAATDAQLAPSLASRTRGDAQNGRRNHPTPAEGVEGVTVELLDDTGEVIDTTVTDLRGNYRFSAFTETGDYQIRLLPTGETIDVLISNGDTHLLDVDFQMLV